MPLTRASHTWLLVALLLVTSIPLLERGSLWGMYAAACACGLQNAMVSTYSGTVIRTTHVSGMFTDLGIFLGHALRGVPVDVRRLRLCGVVICGFLCGGIVGAATFRAYGYSSLLLPAFLTALSQSRMVSTGFAPFLARPWTDATSMI